jgi:hypothetical protein
MRKDHADITIVLDRSQSMSSIVKPTIDGFNDFLGGQQRTPGSADLTAYKFDHEFETMVATQAVQRVAPLTPETFVPRGNTALLDAIGRAILETGKRLAAMPESERAEKVIFVIITDGQENCSKDFNKTKIQEMIGHQSEKYKWEFVYLGANQNAFHEAQGIGIKTANAMTFAANAQSVCDSFTSTSTNLRNFRTGRAANMAYSGDDYDKQAAAGAPDHRKHP